MKKIVTLATAAVLTITLTACGAETAGLSHGDVWEACEEKTRSKTVRATLAKNVSYPRPDDDAFKDISEDGESKVQMKGIVIGKNHAGFEWEVPYTCSAWESSRGQYHFVMATVNGNIIV